MGIPTDLPTFNTNETDVTAPDTTREDDGFVVTGDVPEKPSYKLFNYLLNLYYKWAKYFKEREETVTIANTADANYTADAAENSFGRIVFSGTALTIARDFIVDTTPGRLIFQNDEAQIVTVKTPAGTGIPVAVGDDADLYCDGTNIIEAPGGASGVFLDFDNFIHVQELQTTGTSGGDTVAGIQTRVLNNVVKNTMDGGVTLVSNELVGVPAGNYWVEAEFTAYRCNRVKAFIRDTTSPLTIVDDGLNAYTVAISGGDQVTVNVTGFFTLAGTKDLAIWMDAETAALGGLGIATSAGNEIYANFKLWKV